MKLKKRLIQRVKNKYGLGNLCFYYGYHRVRGDQSLDEYDRQYGGPSLLIICSIKKSHKKVYKNSKSVVVGRRLTHVELERVLSSLQNKKMKARSLGASMLAIPIPTVLFEQLDSEFSDLNSLKQAYLICHLAGI